MPAHHLSGPDLARSRSALSTAFKSLDPFDEPLQEALADRLILYPAVGYELPDAWFEALTRAAATVGEPSAYHAAVEGETGFELEDVWELGLTPDTLRWFETSATDGSRTPIVENAIWSTSGSWGLLISHRQHVVLGGPPAFVEHVRRSIPEADEHAIRFAREMLRYSENASWGRDGLLRLLTHVYGVARAQELMRMAATGPS